MTDMIDLLLTAEYLRGKEKLPLLQQFSQKLDTLKYFVTILWQVKEYSAASRNPTAFRDNRTARFFKRQPLPTLLCKI